MKKKILLNGPNGGDDQWAYEVDCILTVSGDPKWFLDLMENESLKLMLETAIEKEDYETAELIKKHIESKIT